jgi:hypothetical protein
MDGEGWTERDDSQSRKSRAKISYC